MTKQIPRALITFFFSILSFGLFCMDFAPAPFGLLVEEEYYYRNFHKKEPEVENLNHTRRQNFPGLDFYDNKRNIGYRLSVTQKKNFKDIFTSIKNKAKKTAAGRSQWKKADLNPGEVKLIFLISPSAFASIEPYQWPAMARHVKREYNINLEVKEYKHIGLRNHLSKVIRGEVTSSLTLKQQKTLKGQFTQWVMNVLKKMDTLFNTDGLKESIISHTSLAKYKKTLNVMGSLSSQAKEMDKFVEVFKQVVETLQTYLKCFFEGDETGETQKKAFIMSVKNAQKFLQSDFCTLKDFQVNSILTLLNTAIAIFETIS